MSKNNSSHGTNLLVDGKHNKKIAGTMAINRAHIVTFSLPAVTTCPGADKCRKGGYCQAGNYNYDNVQRKLKVNLKVSRTAEFVDMICAELSQKYTYSKYVRIHPVGDFYNITYFKKWVAIAVKNPEVTFYAYTKSINIVKKYLADNVLPANMVITYSYGSKFDNEINPNVDYHAVVIGPNADIPSGYVDGSEDDLVMCKGHKKIALRYHHPNIKFENSGFIEIKNPF